MKLKTAKCGVLAIECGVQQHVAAGESSAELYSIRNDGGLFKCAKIVGYLGNC